MVRKTELAHTTVLITGGGNGIGRLMAMGAAQRGAEVVVWDLSSERAHRVRDEITAHGGSAHAFEVDVSDKAAVSDAAARTLDACQGVDVLINNAGVVSGATLLEASDEAIDRTFDVNTKALFWVTRAFLPGMIERRRGTVVTVASAAGMVGVARQTDYSASKFAAFGFNESLRAEMRLNGTGVSTLIVCPYYINTGMFDGATTRFPRLLPILDEQEVATRILDGIEAGRQRVVLPPMVGLLPLARLLPLAAFDRVVDLLGVNRTMDHFTGRPGELAGEARPVPDER